MNHIYTEERAEEMRRLTKALGYPLDETSSEGEIAVSLLAIMREALENKRRLEGLEK